MPLLKIALQSWSTRVLQEYHIFHLLFCSPIVFTLEALLNPSFVDGDMNRIGKVVSDLHNTFNAIKRAEDALDVHKTSVSFLALPANLLRRKWQD